MNDYNYVCNGNSFAIDAYTNNIRNSITVDGNAILLSEYFNESEVYFEVCIEDDIVEIMLCTRESHKNTSIKLSENEIYMTHDYTDNVSDKVIIVEISDNL